MSAACWTSGKERSCAPESRRHRGRRRDRPGGHLDCPASQETRVRCGVVVAHEHDLDSGNRDRDVQAETTRVDVIAPLVHRVVARDHRAPLRIRIRLVHAGSRGDEGGAGDGSRTRNIQLGRLALYQLSYPRALCRSCASIIPAARTRGPARTAGARTRGGYRTNSNSRRPGCSLCGSPVYRCAPTRKVSRSGDTYASSS